MAVWKTSTRKINISFSSASIASWNGKIWLIDSSIIRVLIWYNISLSFWSRLPFLRQMIPNYGVHWPSLAFISQALYSFINFKYKKILDRFFQWFHDYINYFYFGWDLRPLKIGHAKLMIGSNSTTIRYYDNIECRWLLLLDQWLLIYFRLSLSFSFWSCRREHVLVWLWILMCFVPVIPIIW